MTPATTAHSLLRFQFTYLFASAALLTLSACGPMYRTEYQFTPPENERGEMCIMQCSNNQEHCKQMEELRKESCSTRSDLAQERCRNEIWRDKRRDPKWYECGSESCSADYDRCEQSYRSCYQSCGGKVTAETRCVANCDQISPPLATK